MTSMKAVRIHTYGSTDVLMYEDAPRPAPGEGEVLIRVHATTVNPFDCALRAGYLAAYITPTFPLILGTDVSGVIEEVGAGVTNFKPGDEVFSRAGVYRDGAYAEYAVVVAGDVAMKPRSIDHIHAASVPHVVLTAWQALYGAADIQEGQTVLIHGAAGGVGHIALQLAKLRGAKVIGTASVNMDFIDELGADESVDYSTTKFETVARDVDVVLDTQGGDTQERSWDTLKSGGMMVSTVQPPSAETAAEHGVAHHFVVSNPPIGETLTEVARLIDLGHITPKVSVVLPLTDIRKAHELIEGKHMRGKLVLQVME
jgi:NADPH:quinone reductase-like Zn-dependent oxidoreductase